MNKNFVKLSSKLRHATRLAQIVNVFTSHGFWSVIEKIGIRKNLSSTQANEAKTVSDSADDLQNLDTTDVAELQTFRVGQRLRLAFEELGPAFIKFGQFLSAREDLLPAHITLELRKLQDQVGELSYKEIEKVLKQELDPDLLKDLQMDTKALAAGSIGQVHLATLQSHEKVVVKVQKPDIQDNIISDCQLMFYVATRINRYFPQLRYLNLTQLILEFERTIKGELDYIKEAANTTKVAGNFATNPHVVVPNVHWDYTTNRVLVLDFIDGIPASKVTQLKNTDYSPRLITQRGCEMFLQMAFVDGLLHGDLHAGNLLIQEGNHIGVLDFGVTIRLSQSTRESLAGLLLALTQEDYESLTSHFLELTSPGSGFDPAKFEYEISNTLSPFIGLGLSKISSGSLLWELAGIAARYEANLSGDLIIFLKTLATFEAIGEQLDPNFDLMEACQSYATKIVQKMYGPDAIKRQSMAIGRDLAKLARHSPWQIRRVLDAAVEGKLTLKVRSVEVERLSRSMHHASSRMSISFIIGALIIGSSILSSGRVGDQLFSISIFGILGFGVAALLGLYIIWSLFTRIK